ncbi:hypothetical protein EIN_224700 [Entamoeba invadens IP1]|uniref:Uncharacterized protein n=1 Tax=Entamoeba invadens IP1 TaxID=370355 RepID=A0A0A1U2C9_ENTIV|nr:hypothetical protein EIN_224700 [Entamoeba invadens IP1]ELP88217.1 hypothetical protein EIN_224700 [Entamoeba invadens IP1]|eukprot:XP_004254988.1 hypothetical protein EIN_224700 [Entamoeba invadens IP1]
MLRHEDNLSRQIEYHQSLRKARRYNLFNQTHCPDNVIILSTPTNDPNNKVEEYNLSCIFQIYRKAMCDLNNTNECAIINGLKTLSEIIRDGSMAKEMITIELFQRLLCVTLNGDFLVLDAVLAFLKIASTLPSGRVGALIFSSGLITVLKRLILNEYGRDRQMVALKIVSEVIYNKSMLCEQLMTGGFYYPFENEMKTIFMEGQCDSAIKLSLVEFVISFTNNMANTFALIAGRMFFILRDELRRSIPEVTMLLLEALKNTSIQEEVSQSIEERGLKDFLILFQTGDSIIQLKVLELIDLWFELCRTVQFQEFIGIVEFLFKSAQQINLRVLPLVLKFIYKVLLFKPHTILQLLFEYQETVQFFIVCFDAPNTEVAEAAVQLMYSSCLTFGNKQNGVIDMFINKGMIESISQSLQTYKRINNEKTIISMLKTLLFIFSVCCFKTDHNNRQIRYNIFLECNNPIMLFVSTGCEQYLNNVIFMNEEANTLVSKIREIVQMEESNFIECKKL